MARWPGEAVTDLAVWLGAQLDHDEQWARAASQAYPYAEGATLPADGVHWRWVAGPDWQTVHPDPVLDAFVAPPGEPCWLATVEEWPSGSPGRSMPRSYAYEIVEMDAAAAGHIALHDPARVLRQVSAHRAILDAYVEAIDFYNRHRSAPAGEVTGLRTAVLLIAAIFKERDGWDPSWTVEG